MSDRGAAPEPAGAHLATRVRVAVVLWALMLPSLLGLIVFTYLPNLQSIKYAFYKWDGGMTEEYRGLANFRTAFGADPLFWRSFSVIGILLAANLVKMWPAIFAAVTLHRLRSARAQYVYRVLFVVPMVIPALVTLLLWKSFFNANVGIFNVFLRATGLMRGLAWLDAHWPPLTAFTRASLLHFRPGAGLWVNSLSLPLKLVPVLFGGGAGLSVWGVWVLLFARGARALLRLWLFLPILLGLGLLWGADSGRPLFAAAARGIPLVLCAWLVGVWLRRQDSFVAVRRAQALGWTLIALGALLFCCTSFWTEPTHAFDFGRPAWIGDGNLILPAVVLWGFPWIGSVGVLIYLAGLANISQEVYEAAELDGIGFWGKLFKVELPLIMTQVRINLIFITIATLGEYGFFLILLGPSGGPNNAGLTPGLYMYQQAFADGHMGYACALGLMMAVIILYITVIYQRHLKVDK